MISYSSRHSFLPSLPGDPGGSKPVDTILAKLVQERQALALPAVLTADDYAGKENE